MKAKTTLVVLLDSFRHDYYNPMDTPYLYSLKKHATIADTLINTGGYCERSVFMTGAFPKETDNYFAMALTPIGYIRPSWEPSFNVPRYIRDRLCMTEDLQPDFEYGKFKNWTTSNWIESFWDVMKTNHKTFEVEACIALGILSYRGRTTHGTRPIQLADKFKNNADLYYIQFSEIDQRLHYLGTTPEKRRGLLRNVDAKVEWLVNQARSHFENVNLLVFGDHGMADIKERIDLSLEYPQFKEGWDYLYLKSSADVQFWVFNPMVTKHIMNDPQLKNNGEFLSSPSKRQADIIWRARNGLLISPCHFHGKNDPLKAMHGWDPTDDNQKGMALVTSFDKRKKERHIQRILLNDICPTICDLVGIRYPITNMGYSMMGGEINV